MLTPQASVELRQHFVAFLDVLGFSQMVESDVQAETQKNLVKLFRCHQSASVIFKDDVSCSIIQFSDSIVIAMPYSIGKFEWFASRVGDYQRLLLDEHLLCRGGIAVDKHFSNGSFTFSAGLIRAYRVESEAARYPRVVISPEVLDLVYPEIKAVPPFLIREDDGLYFVDYLGLTKRKKPASLKKSISAVVNDLVAKQSASVREKGLWLASYADAVLGTTCAKPKFVGKSLIAAD